MNRKYKGQGALEYLLLIGGAVLIAVIVIALLVGMGGQSRDAAQEQADRAQQASDVPQPAQIVSVESLFANCSSSNGDANASLAWRPIGEGGTYRLFFEDSRRNRLEYSINLQGGMHTYSGTDTNSYILSTTDDLSLDVFDINIHTSASDNTCGDSYYVFITTEKNQQTVSSARFRFGWWGN